MAHLILSLSKENNLNTVRFNKTHEEVSEMFGVARPSLTRAMREMVADGLIRTDGKSIMIIDKSGLSALLR